MQEESRSEGPATRGSRGPAHNLRHVQLRNLLDTRLESPCPHPAPICREEWNGQRIGRRDSSDYDGVGPLKRQESQVGVEATYIGGESLGHLAAPGAFEYETG